MRRLSLVFVVAMMFTACFAGLAAAERDIVVNGQRLNPAEIRYLEQWTCAPVPNGAYWLHMQSGIWGYAGNPIPQGHISDRCGAQARRPSLSERGRLYSPGEILRSRP